MGKSFDMANGGIETHNCKQFAVLDIYDPVMLRVEHLIPRR